MKTLIFALLTLLMLTNSVCADLPAVKDRLRMPAIMLSPTPEEWVRLHRLSERSPQVLLETLDRYIQACRNGETENNPLAPDSWTYLREYVLDRLGDTAGPEVIPALETFLQRWKTEAGGAGPTALNELSVRLVMEHIRARQRGRTEYIAEMFRWLKGEYTPVAGQIQIRSVRRQGAPADALEQYLKEMIVGTERAWRVIEAARALGILRVKQAAPLLAEKYHLWKDGWSRLQLPYLVRALAQIGDAPSLFSVMPHFLKDGWMLQPYLVDYLEPGEVDPVWAYWQARTQGMSLERTVQTIVQRVAEGEGGFGVSEILSYFGPSAVPVLLSLLAQPPAGPKMEAAQATVIRALGLLRAPEAVEPLRQTLHTSSSWWIQKECIKALGQIGDVSVVPDLASFTGHADRSMRVAAVYALGDLKSPEAIPVLLRVLREHPDEATRSRAAEVLGLSRQRWLVPVLVYQTMVETSDLVREYLEDAIYMLKKQTR